MALRSWNATEKIQYLSNDISADFFPLRLYGIVIDSVLWLLTVYSSVVTFVQFQPKHFVPERKRRTKNEIKKQM